MKKFLILITFSLFIIPSITSAFTFSNPFSLPASFSLSLSGNNTASNQSQKAIGYLNPITNVSGRYSINGWSCLKGQAKSVVVDLYFGGPIGTGTLFKHLNANASSTSAIDTQCSTTGIGHTFSYRLTPLEFEANKGKSVYAYGISGAKTITAGGDLLTNSGIKIPETISTTTKSVKGHFTIEDSNGQYKISGWSCIKGEPKSIKVHLYFGGPSGTGTLFREVNANATTSSAIDAQCNTVNIPHTFLYKLTTDEFNANKGKSVYAYGISDVTGIVNELLANSGIKIPTTTPVVVIPKEPFKIVWHLGPKLETVADAITNNADIIKLNSITDGYYFLTMGTGVLSYWPNRPEECSLNFNPNGWKTASTTSFTDLGGGLNGLTIKSSGKSYNLSATCPATTSPYYAKCDAWNNGGGIWNYPKSLNTFCSEQNGIYIDSQIGAGMNADTTMSISTKRNTTSQRLEESAVGRIIQKLNINNRGNKKVINEVLLNNKDFTYSTTTALLSVNHLDYSYKTLEKFGTHTDMVMAYHEPTIQRVHGSDMINIPALSLNTSGGCNVAGCTLAGLNNDVLGLLKGAFTSYSLDLSKNTTGFKAPLLSTDIRLWTQTEVNNFKDGYSNLYSATFEGGPLAISQRANPILGYSAMSFIENFAIGTNAILQKGKDVYFLMPNSKSPDELKSSAYKGTRSIMIDDYRQYVTSLDLYLKKYGLTTGICTSRIHLIPTGYGSKFHSSILPMRDNSVYSSGVDSNGKTVWANTVSGMIGALDEIRTEICGA